MRTLNLVNLLKPFLEIGKLFHLNQFSGWRRSFQDDQFCINISLHHTGKNLYNPHNDDIRKSHQVETLSPCGIRSLLLKILELIQIGCFPEKTFVI